MTYGKFNSLIFKVNNALCDDKEILAQCKCLFRWFEFSIASKNGFFCSFFTDQPNYPYQNK